MPSAVAIRPAAWWWNPRSLPGHPEIRVVGDLCSYKHTRDGKPLPGMARTDHPGRGFVGKIGALVAGQPRLAGLISAAWRCLTSMPSLIPAGLKFKGGIGGFAVRGPPGLHATRENRVTLLVKWMFAVV